MLKQSNCRGSERTNRVNCMTVPVTVLTVLPRDCRAVGIVGLWDLGFRAWGSRAVDRSTAFEEPWDIKTPGN